MHDGLVPAGDQQDADGRGVHRPAPNLAVDRLHVKLQPAEVARVEPAELEDDVTVRPRASLCVRLG